MIDKLAIPQLNNELTIEEDGENLLVYDPASNKAISLNSSSSLVFFLCDGASSVAEIIDELINTHAEIESGVLEAQILETLTNLEVNNLITFSTQANERSELNEKLKAADVSASSQEFSATPVTQEHINKKLTVAMATYDDYDGVYFTVQSLRLHHPEVLEEIEILIVDNNPSGKCGASLRRLAEQGSNIRYIPITARSGTAVREICFQEASTEFVLCVDCHVLIEPSAIKRLMEYYQQNPNSNDIIHGPMLNDSLTSVLTHFNPIWRSGMYGVWGVDERGAAADNPPFEIPMQGLGLFSCRKKAWPGFNPNFRGFGGEEGYIHEKFRQAGGKAICLPFLRWLHRFERPFGIPYQINWEDRILNYFIGFAEIGFDLEPIKEHFGSHLNKNIVDECFKVYQTSYANK